MGINMLGFPTVAAAAATSLQLCLTLSDPMGYSPPDSSIHGIFQARVLEWGAIAFSGISHSFQFSHSVVSNSL